MRSTAQKPAVDPCPSHFLTTGIEPFVLNFQRLPALRLAVGQAGGAFSHQQTLVRLRLAGKASRASGAHVETPFTWRLARWKTKKNLALCCSY